MLSSPFQGEIMFLPWSKKIAAAAVFLGLPLTAWYHEYTENPIINVQFISDHRLDQWADWFLAPSHYLFAARAVSFDQEKKLKIDQRFDYQNNFYLKTAVSILTWPITHTIGMVLKGAALTTFEVFSQKQAYLKSFQEDLIPSHLDYYKKIGIEIIDESAMLEAECQHHKRRPEDLKNLENEKQALEVISEVLKKHQIPFWIDCGTCLGAYRYGGIIPWDFDIDLSILRPDFWNAFQALKKLDPNEYVVQDWSGRDKKGSYLKVYVKKTRALIDIYTFDIDEEKRTVRYVIGNENSIFLPEGWKMRERLYTKPSAFEQVFPLKLAYFDGLYLPVPNQTKEYLMLRYGENIGPVKIFNPETNEYEKDLTHPYWNFQYAK